MITKQDLWHFFKIQKDLFSLVNPNTNLPFLEGIDGYVQYRLFFSKRDAETYRNIVIERDKVKPDNLSIYPTNINELFHEKVINGLYGYSREIFKMPLKITIAMLHKHDTIVEDDVLDEMLYFD